MTITAEALQALKQQLVELVDNLESSAHGELIYQALTTFTYLTEEELERLDWKILRSSFRDMHEALRIFAPYRHTRKISIFGSARTQSDHPAYTMAATFAQKATAQGFMIMTGAGGGIMEAGNKGAGAGNSFGLNIDLPFEQGANAYIEGDPRLIHFKYFFTRKLFLLKETDAIAVFPGGFGTQDEAFECLTLCQTGKAPPTPMVLVDAPGGTYWRDWDTYIQKQLSANNLINPEDRQLYTITDNVNQAIESLSHFYRVYHSCRYVKGKLVLRLNQDITNDQLAALNQRFSDILLSGQIEKTAPLPRELEDEQPLTQTHFIRTVHLPRLILHFNQRDFGRLYELIHCLNQMAATEAACHPERK